MIEREDPTPEQYEQTVAQWWRDPEYEAWLDKLEQQRKDEDA
jgi:hypothetical protein